MRLAYTIAPGRGETNFLLAAVADELTKAGWNLCGTVQTDIPRQIDHRCDMDVTVLPAGPTIRISQSLGTQARGCRLNADALEHAVALTQAELKRGADLLIVNKFGKHEADGRGFRDIIAEAVMRDVPVLMGVNNLNVDAFFEYCPDGVALEPDEASVLDWVAGLRTPSRLMCA